MLTAECTLLIQKHNAVTDQLSELIVSNRKILSKIDLDINDLLHILEYVSLSGSNTSKISKKLKAFYRQRRSLKEDIIAVDNILRNNKFGKDEILNSVSRETKYKAEAIEKWTKFNEIAA